MKTATFAKQITLEVIQCWIQKGLCWLQRTRLGGKLEFLPVRCQLSTQAHQSVVDVRNEMECPNSFHNGQENEDMLENVQM